MSQTSFHVVRGYLGIHYSRCRDQALSRVEGGLGVLSTCGRTCGVLLDFQSVRQASSRVSREKLGFLWSGS